MIAREKLPGQPLNVLSIILGSWIIFRVMTWQAPAWVADFQDMGTARLLVNAPVAEEQYFADIGQGAMVGGLFSALGQDISGADAAGWYGTPATLPVNLDVHYTASGDASGPLLAAGHQLMWMASLAKVTVPQELAAYVGRGMPPPLSASVQGVQALGGQSTPAALARSRSAPALVKGGRIAGLPMHG